MDRAVMQVMCLVFMMGLMFMLFTALQGGSKNMSNPFSTSKPTTSRMVTNYKVNSKDDHHLHLITNKNSKQIKVVNADKDLVK